MNAIAINGFGRIGRLFFRQAYARNEFPVRAINDLGTLDSLAYLLKYDTVYGRFEGEVRTDAARTKFQKAESVGKLVVNGNNILIFQEKDPANLPWGELGIDVVVEASGVFARREKASVHLTAGAKRVLITAPADGAYTATPNVHFEDITKNTVTSNASCTTNCTNPVLRILDRAIGIEKAMLTTVHGYTATQSLVDSPARGSDVRRGRAAAQNIVPSTTGAAEAVIASMPEFENRFDGSSLRVPVIAGSLIDVTFVAKRNTTAEEINAVFTQEAAKPEWRGILKVSRDPLVSSDVLKEPYGSVVDLTLTKVVGGNMGKVFSWYDNEWGYCAMLVKHLELLNSLL